MIRMYNGNTGEIDRNDYQFFQEGQVEVSTEDVDYSISPATIDLPAARVGDADLINLLRGAVGDSEGIEITWVHPE